MQHYKDFREKRAKMLLDKAANAAKRAENMATIPPDLESLNSNHFRKMARKYIQEAIVMKAIGNYFQTEKENLDIARVCYGAKYSLVKKALETREFAQDRKRREEKNQ